MASSLERIALVDFEASSLSSRSYPIEVGWCLAESGAVESHLIKPLDDWTDWDPQSETVHGIRRQALVRDGAGVEFVARRMVEQLRDHDLYADGSHDQRWINQLFRAAGLAAPELRPFDKLLDQIVRPDLEGEGDWLARELARATEQGAILDEAYARAGAIAPKTHRAGPDARHLHEVLRQVFLLIGRSPR